MRTPMVLTIGLACALSLGPANLVAAAGTRSAVTAAVAPVGSGGADEAARPAQKAATIAALREIAKEMTGRVYSQEEAEQWLEKSDEFDLRCRVLERRLESGKVFVRVEVSVDEDAFRAVIGRPPRYIVVGVAVYEEIKPDPAAETAVRQAFLLDGYEVLDQSIEDTVVLRDRLRAVRRGDPDAAKWLTEQFAADLIVYGEAFAEYSLAGGRYGAFRCTATCELHVVTADTAREIAQGTGTAVAEAETDIQAAKLALKRAGESAAHIVLPLADRYFQTTPVQVVVHKVAYFRTSQDMLQALRERFGAQAVVRPRTDMQDKTMSCDVRGAGSAQAVAAVLQELANPRVQIIEASGLRVVAQVVD